MSFPTITQSQFKDFLARIDVEEIDTVLQKRNIPADSPYYFDKSDKEKLQNGIQSLLSDSNSLMFTMVFNSFTNMMSDVSKINDHTDTKLFCDTIVKSSFVKNFLVKVLPVFGTNEFLEYCVSSVTSQQIDAIQYQNDGFFDVLCPFITFELGAIGFVNNAMNVQALICPRRSSSLKNPTMEHYSLCRILSKRQFTYTKHDDGSTRCSRRIR